MGQAWVGPGWEAGGRGWAGTLITRSASPINMSGPRRWQYWLNEAAQVGRSGLPLLLRNVDPTTLVLVPDQAQAVGGRRLAALVDP